MAQALLLRGGMMESLHRNVSRLESVNRKNRATILICEDETLLRKTVARDLTKAGYTVIEAQSAESAVDVFDRQRVDLLITDVRLPGMSGWELVDRVHAALEGLPVIVMSAYGTGGYASRKQVCVFLDKPFAMESLRTEVKKALQGRSGASWGGAL